MIRFMATHTSINLLSGVALDGFDAIKETKTQKAKSIFSPNFNIGIGIRHRLGKYSAWFIDIQTRYNFVSYDTDGGTDLSGNVITIRFSFGFVSNPLKYELLRELGY